MAKSTRAEWLKLPAAAESRGVSIKTLRRRIASGELPARRLGARIIVVNTRDLDALFRPMGGAA